MCGRAAALSTRIYGARRGGLAPIGILVRRKVILISTTHQPATDIGFLLHKNPHRVHVSDLTFGKSYVVYPEATDERATAALIVDIDPVRLVRGMDRAKGSLTNYVNDRPYVASSFLSVAIADAFGTAMSGRSKERPELVETPLPLEVEIPVLPCRSHPDRINRLFEPLGYAIHIKRHPLDPEFPEWGQSHLYRVHLSARVTVRDALRQIYLLLPVLDAKKHYFMDAREVDKIVQKGRGWLESHPEKNWILRSSLGRKPSLFREALEQLANAEEELLVEAEDTDSALAGPEMDESDPVTPTDRTAAPPLHRLRHDRIVELVKDLRPKSVLDLGCGEGKLLRLLVPIQGIERIVGVDVSMYALERAAKALHLEDATPRFAERVQLIHGSLMYKDERLRGFDLCTVVEVIEHLDQPRLAAFEKVVFGSAQPNAVVVTTPNREYNALYEISGLRHEDHRFEWDRQQFRRWSESVAATFGYSVDVEGIGDEHPNYGPPSQLALFRR